MGGDGGALISRDLIIQTVKRRGLVEDIRLTAHANFTHCALSGLSLHPPLVVDELGLIYNKAAVLQYLLDVAAYKESLKTLAAAAASGGGKKESAEAQQARLILEEKMNQFAHIQRMTDLFQCTVSMFSEHNKTSASSGDKQAARKAQEDLCDYIMCPILDIKADGLVPFIIMRDCCCVMSMKGFEQIKTPNACCLCMKPYSERYQSNFKPQEAVTTTAAATEKDKLLSFPLQHNELPYITMIPTEHDSTILETIMIARREHLGRPTPTQVRAQLKKQKMLRLKLQGDGEELVQLAPIQGTKK